MTSIRRSVLAAGLPAAFIVAAATGAAAREPTFPPVEEPVKITCKGDFDAVWVDPNKTNRRATYETFEAALCRVKPGGTVYVHPHPDKWYKETVRVAKPNLRFRPAAGGSAYLAAPAAAEGASGACFIVEAGGRTIVSNFVFEQGSDVCVDVRRGGLTLVDTLVLGAEGDKASIGVSGLGSLDFRGARPADFGVCLKDATKSQCRVTNTPSGVGVDAATGSRLALAGLTFANLSVGVRSSATTNDISDVAFRDNETGAIVTDAAIGAEAPPAVSIRGGAFERNEDGLRLVGSSSGAFRGRVTIEPSRSGARVLFQDNDDAVRVAGAGLSQFFAVQGVDFDRNDVALGLPMPAYAETELQNVVFTRNVSAISLAGPLNGTLRLIGDTQLSGDKGGGVVIRGGAGKLDANLAAIGGVEPAFRFDGDFFDYRRVDIVSRGSRPSASSR